MLKTLSEAYELKCTMNKAEIATIEAAIDHHSAIAETHERRAVKQRQKAKKLEEELRSRPTVDWKKEVIEPLAAELAKQTGKPAKVFGPCGIGAKVTIVLLDNPAVSHLDQNTLELVIEPEFEDGHMVFYYETGETCDRYKPDSIGALNGLNNVTARLPDSVNEILKLFKLYPASPF